MDQNPVGSCPVPRARYTRRKLPSIVVHDKYAHNIIRARVCARVYVNLRVCVCVCVIACVIQVSVCCVPVPLQLLYRRCVRAIFFLTRTCLRPYSYYTLHIIIQKQWNTARAKRTSSGRRRLLQMSAAPLPATTRENNDNNNIIIILYLHI